MQSSKSLQKSFLLVTLEMVQLQLWLGSHPLVRRLYQQSRCSMTFNNKLRCDLFFFLLRCDLSTPIRTLFRTVESTYIQLVLVNKVVIHFVSENIYKQKKLLIFLLIGLQVITNKSRDLTRSTQTYRSVILLYVTPS